MKRKHKYDLINSPCSYRRKLHVSLTTSTLRPFTECMGIPGNRNSDAVASILNQKLFPVPTVYPFRFTEHLMKILAIRGPCAMCILFVGSYLCGGYQIPFEQELLTWLVRLHFLFQLCPLIFS